MKVKLSSRVKIAAILSILVCWFLFGSTGLNRGLNAQTDSGEWKPPYSFSLLAEKASPSVVNISTEKVIERPGMGGMPFGRPFDEDDPFKEFFERFFGDRMPRKFKQRGLGSGFIIDAEGYILTNNHVVEDAEKIEVTLESKKEYEAKIIGRDPKTDLALIKIEADKSLTPLSLGDSDKLKVGDWVVAIGSPFGLGHTVTAGIVSAKYRYLGLGVYDDFIQTDASINPGNSGGPLLNVEGEVVGINSAIFSRGGGNVGIGFAIPVNMAKDLLPQLREGKVIRGWLGVAIQGITPELREKLNLKEEKGALVSDVTEGSPAEEAGFKRGDVIVSFDGKEIKEVNELPYLVAKTPVGQRVKIEVVRNGKKSELEAVIAEDRQEAVTSPPAEKEEAGPQFGMRLQENSPEFARRNNLTEHRGLVVVGLAPNGLAAMAGFQVGDIILELDREQVADLARFNEKTRQYSRGETLLFLIKRQTNTLYLAMKVPG